MDTSTVLTKNGTKQRVEAILGISLSGVSRQAVMLIWGLVTILSLLSIVLSIYSLNVWDRVPASQAPTYFAGMTADEVQNHGDYQNVVLQSGLTLGGYALIFTIARILGGLALLILGILLVLRYNDRLIAMLMAIILSVFAAAGIWSNPLFSWAVSVAPWMKIPAGLLGWLLWCSVIVFYSFPDGRFTPRWMLWLGVLVIPISFFMVFDVQFFLNPYTWPSPLDLLPTIVFIGGGLFALLYRYSRMQGSEKKRSLRWYVLSLSLLTIAYFVDFSISNIYPLFGKLLIQSYQDGMRYVLVFEPVWYALEIFFALGLGLSVFRYKILEG